MPLDPSVQAEIDAYLASKIVKVRIPELPPNTTYGDVSLLDRMPLWMNGTNKTVWADLVTLKAILTTGGTGTITPVLTGDKIIHEVTSAEAGGNTVLIPELAGKTFFLRLEGRPVKPSEFTILNAGGFKMNDVATGVPYELTEGQRFDLEVYELQAGTSGTPAALSSSYIVGKVNVSSNTTLNGVNHANKIIQLRGGATKVVLTLPDIATTPENAVLIIEASINNDWQTKVQTQGGQFIYMNNSSRSALYVGKGEVLVLFRDTDGWYVINDFGNYYKNLGKPYAAYSYETNENEIVCNGSDILKEDYPRLWEKIQTVGGGLTTDSTVWDANKGMWLEVDSNTFRLPDLRDMFLRGADTQTPGTFEDQDTKAQTVTFPQVNHNASGTNYGVTDGPLGGPGSRTFDTTGGTETRPMNTRILWVTKY
jgi:hypothetical protein